jgi:hypothetical protein
VAKRVSQANGEQVTEPVRFQLGVLPR